MSVNNRESGSDFASVTQIGAAYLAVSAYFAGLIFSPTADLHKLSGLAIFGVLIQLGFLAILRAQRLERCKLLNNKTGWLASWETRGDVPLTVINCLIGLAMFWSLTWALLAFLVPHIPIKK